MGMTICPAGSTRLHVWLCLGVVLATGCGRDDAAMLEANKDVVRRWAELEDQGNVDALADLAAADCVFHYPGGAEVQGIEALMEHAAQSVAAFSDAHRQIEHEIAEGNLVATRYTFTARHTGEFLGLPPTGNRLSFTFMSLCRMANRRIAECWIEFDNGVLVRQMGAGVDADGSES